VFDARKRPVPGLTVRIRNIAAVIETRWPPKKGMLEGTMPKLCVPIHGLSLGLCFRESTPHASTDGDLGRLLPVVRPPLVLFFLGGMQITNPMKLDNCGGE
jgi:hypothetical protein